MTAAMVTVLSGKGMMQRSLNTICFSAKGHSILPSSLSVSDSLSEILWNMRFYPFGDSISLRVGEMD